MDGWMEGREGGCMGWLDWIGTGDGTGDGDGDDDGSRCSGWMNGVS